MAKTVRPYGSWKSPITSDLISSATIGFAQTALDGPDAYWIETRPAEGGRHVIVRRAADGTVSDVTPQNYNARTRVHEYGGGAYVVSDGEIFFSNFSDQHLYRQSVSGSPSLFNAETGMRYADGVVDRRRNRLICVREDHGVPGREPVNTLVSLPLAGDGEAVVLASGYDFYSNPRLSPDAGRLSWLCWNHPNMPWDGCELWVGSLKDDGTIDDITLAAGGAEESVFQPEWSPDGALVFISDRNGWWNLYRWNAGRIEPLCEMEAEFGRPQWNFGYSNYAFAGADQWIVSYNKEGVWNLATLNPRGHALADIQTGYTDIMWVKADSRRAVFRAGSPSRLQEIVQLDLSTMRCETLRRATASAIDEGYVSHPEPITFATENGLSAHGFFYRPANKDYAAPAGELPPLLVKSHGGPTGATTTMLSQEIHFWTSRGIAVLDVNYGGSTGYGRAYRQRLHGAWGVVDVDDCVNGALHLVRCGQVDGNRLMISGGSAGGYTTLCALTFRDAFKCGASHYGIGDLEAMARDTHKFESRYLDRLVGPYPDARDLYVERSPIFHVDRLSCPVIFFQGLEDRVVPPNQAGAMVEALCKKGIPVAYVAFAGEQHGFRRAATIKRALDGELYFYSRILGFELADPVEPVEIENLPGGMC